MPADPARLEELARVLLNRADDLYYLGQELVRHGDRAKWRCAKATRFRQSLRGRRAEAMRLAVQLRDLGRWLRAQSQQAAAASTPDGAAPAPAPMPRKST
ncbi:hypothetical protein [Allorhizocola rhizosphaerae]|uniref:hypothetical protein n=1 Tax=Allorhizocola rhizosphaerae TaxID=1872709 RepID=UPI000E3D072C|nr:hypothetical protein [Allorhizocola rhizosphaerae]